ncbi:hypothetical protein ACFZAM_27375 [Streptomyces sp. NPDC008079]|uniref:hypothetical protein n=1 Tax=Streptomyces sp. NPDC008079 TaxID=3364806 RepID=UPI0036F0C9C2
MARSPVGCAFLAVVRADDGDRRPAPDTRTPLTCTPLTCNEQPVYGTDHRLGWSDWRRHHQARSQTSRYRRQATQT